MRSDVSAVITLPTTSFDVRPSSLARSRSISELDRGIIDVLRNQHVADPGTARDFPGERGGEVMGRVQVGAADLHIDRRGQAHVEHGIHQAAATGNRC